MKRPKLDAIRAEVERRLMSGERLHWRDVWAMSDDASRSWAHSTLRSLHAAGSIRIVKWVRGQSGPAMPVYAWGAPNKEPKRPKAFTSSEKSRRWRRAHKDQIMIYRIRTRHRRRKSPFMDPLVAALIGYRRQGDGWVKR